LPNSYPRSLHPLDRSSAQGNDNDDDVPNHDSDDEPKRKKRKKKKGKPESDSSDDEDELKLEKVDPPLPVRPLDCYYSPLISFPMERLKLTELVRHFVHRLRASSSLTRSVSTFAYEHWFVPLLSASLPTC
jgi:hypothetical protein